MRGTPILSFTNTIEAAACQRAEHPASLCKSDGGLCRSRVHLPKCSAPSPCPVPIGAGLEEATRRSAGPGAAGQIAFGQHGRTAPVGWGVHEVTRAAARGCSCLCWLEAPGTAARLASRDGSQHPAPLLAALCQAQREPPLFVLARAGAALNFWTTEKAGRSSKNSKSSVGLLSNAVIRHRAADKE